MTGKTVLSNNSSGTSTGDPNSLLLFKSENIAFSA